jgi:hypothetical protein
LLFGVWVIPHWRGAVQKRFPDLQATGTDEKYAEWLVKTSFDDWTNLHHVIVWAWETRLNEAPTYPTTQSLLAGPQQPLLESAADTDQFQAWCKTRHLGNNEINALTSMGFTIGDDLMELCDDEWKEAGVPPLVRNRIKKALLEHP